MIRALLTALLQGPRLSTYDLHHFGLREMIEAGRDLRRLGEGAPSMEAAAQQIADLFYERFADAAGTPNCVLVRCFKTSACADLPPELQRIVLTSDPHGGQVSESTLCLCLLASRGDEPEWNGRIGSVGHRAIPLISAEAVAGAPMIARLFQQLGVEDILSEDFALMVDEEGRTFNVFHVEEALGSEFVPAQDVFVRPYGVRSVVGFGGELPSCELFAFVLFSRVHIEHETAELFRTLALGAKLVLLPFAGQRTWGEVAQ